MFVFLCCMFVFYFVHSVFGFVLCIFVLLHTFVSFLFYISLPTTATGWKPKCSKQISYKNYEKGLFISSCLYIPTPVCQHGTTRRISMKVYSSVFLENLWR
jgi:hypothetical protein